MYHKKNVDFAYLLWEDFVYQVERKDAKKSNEMYYLRFTKVIINFFITKDPSIPRRNKVNWNYVRDDQMTMDMTIDQQVALDEALVPHASRLSIRKINFRLRSDITSKESTLQVVYDVLRLTPFYKPSPFFRAFLVMADVPEIYMQEFWATATVHQHPIEFKMDTRKHIVDLEAFREMLHISPRVSGQSFAELPFKEEILEFLRFLGHSAQIKTLTDVNVNKLYQPWRSFAAVINKCLTGKCSGFDRVPNVPSDDSEEEISWNSSDDEDVDDQTKGSDDKKGEKTDESDDDDDDDDQDEAEKVNDDDMMRKKYPRLMNKKLQRVVGMMKKLKAEKVNDDDDDDEEEISKIDEQEATESGEDDEETKSDGVSEEEETTEKEEESFDLIPRTPKDGEDDGNGEDDIGLRISEEERMHEEEEADELYRDVDINQGRGLQVSQDIEDSHVTLTPTHSDGQQESSSISSFVTSLLNPIIDPGIESIFTTCSSTVTPMPSPKSTMTPSIITTTTTASQPPIPPTPIPSDIFPTLPTFASIFRFEDRVKSLEVNFYNIPGSVHQYMYQQMPEAVREAVQIQTDRLQDSIQRENDEFLRTIDDNMKKIIKEQ
nr:hypothetical protein [Tanacetum cinerariifolium]